MSEKPSLFLSFLYCETPREFSKMPYVCGRTDRRDFGRTTKNGKRYVKCELNIHCIYIDRGCQEILQLQHLERHEATCGFTPAVCTNQGCGATLNQRDLIHHESEICEFRKLKCHSCGETTKTLTDIEKRVANVEKNVAKIENIVTIETDIKNTQTDMATNVTNMETRMANVETNMADMKTDIEAVNNEVRGLKTALIEGFDEMKDVLVKMEDKIEENTRKVRNTASGDKEI